MSENLTTGTFEGERNELFERHGKGKAVYNNGDIYEGSFAAGKRNGLGTYQYMKDDKLEATYTGNWKDGLKHGSGKTVYTDGGLYEGEYVAGDRQGFGTYVYSNQDWYKGEWRANKRHGLGEYYKFDLKYTAKCHFEEGNITGTVRVEREDAIIEGAIENGKITDFKVIEEKGAPVEIVAKPEPAVEEVVQIISAVEEPIKEAIQEKQVEQELSPIAEQTVLPVELSEQIVLPVEIAQE